MSETNTDIIAHRIAERKLDRELEMVGAVQGDFAHLTFTLKQELLRKVQNAERARGMANMYPSEKPTGYCGKDE